MAIDNTRLCTLQAAVGGHEGCPKRACPFWDGGRCAFEQLEVEADPALAAWLLELRERLATAEATAGVQAAHTLFSHLLNESDE
ncbi:MAG TPA: hypothetical protein VKB43_10370 [Gaiellaceae bacterium]|nr:hypothetical protein [Gaiellaceae bacterium]